MPWPFLAASMPSHNTTWQAKAHICGTCCVGTLEPVAGLQHCYNATGLRPPRRSRPASGTCECPLQLGNAG